PIILEYYPKVLTPTPELIMYDNHIYHVDLENKSNPTTYFQRKNFKFKLATCAFVNFAVIENTFLYAVVSNFISLLNASLAVRYPNILRGRLFIHCWIFLIV